MSSEEQTKPLVTIVLPTRNRAELLPHALRSILGQTYENLELIIVDDCSSDDTARVVESFKDTRIKYTKNATNVGLPNSLNIGFSLSTGRYLTWTSDDNMYAETAIKKMANLLQARNCDFVYADYYRFSRLDGKSGKAADVHLEKLSDQLDLKKGNQVGGCFLYTREIYREVGSYDPQLSLVEDYDYFIRISRRFKMCHLPEALYYFRRDEITLYHSRFAEVKAADILIRYKHGLLDKKEATDAIVSLIVKSIAGLRNPILRAGYAFTGRISYNLANKYKDMMADYLARKCGRAAEGALTAFDSKQKTFNETKCVIKGIITHFAEIKPD